jgi:ABC-2 type transport system ATP-binding protein
VATEENNVIDVHGLSKSFHGKAAVIDVSLQVKKGEIYGFLGPNGSGKTTTIRMLCGLLTPDAGTGYCLGYDILTESDAIKRQVGYMPQEFSLYEELSIYENLEFIAKIYGMQNIKESVESTLIDSGLDKQKNQLAGRLSGGWKQRLALACALLHHPLLLLLDEPTAGVDPKARRDFWDHIHRLATKGITTLVSTHYMDEAERCNRLAYIMQGHILVRGTLDAIIKQSHLITWEVRGKQLPALAQQLQGEVDQVISYGQSLHVSDKEPQKFIHLMEQYSQGYLWTRVATSPEDVFISLVGLEDTQT